MNTFTQESLSVFYNESQKNFIELREKINTQTDTIKKLEDQLHVLSLEKAIKNEMNEHLNYKLSVMNDKILASEQKVNDLNNIMMKHFAYKSEIKQLPVQQPNVQVQPPGKGFAFNNV
jgi:hypothetical protein